MSAKSLLPTFLTLTLSLAPALLACTDDSDDNGDSDDEGFIDDPSYGDINPEQLERMRNPPGGDGPFHMVNFVRFREFAEYPDGRETTLTGREANQLYEVQPFLEAMGAEPVFIAEAEDTPLGDGTEWDQITVVSYPSRTAFIEMLEDPEYQAIAVHKDAGLAQSLVIVTELLPSPLPEGFEPPDSPFPATEQDPPVEVCHLIRYRDVAQYAEDSAEPERSGREAMDLYSQAASMAAIPLGAYATARFVVEGVFIGDGREWDVIHINHMPSHAAWDALRSDPDRSAAQYHREAAIADTYTVAGRAFVDQLRPAP
ncbi:MAG: DUF1330 domain-containing protein [Myxococcota bacterium]